MKKAIFIRTGLTTEAVCKILNKYSTDPAQVHSEDRDWITLIVNKNIDWGVVCAKEKIPYFGSDEISITK